MRFGGLRRRERGARRVFFKPVRAEVPPDCRRRMRGGREVLVPSGNLRWKISVRSDLPLAALACASIPSWVIPRRRTAWQMTAMSVFFGGNDARRSVQRPTFHAHDQSGLLPDDAAGGEPCLHRAGSTAALHRRCLEALLVGNSRCRTDHGLHAQTARQLERGLPQGVRQAVRSIRLGEVIAGAATCRYTTGRPQAGPDGLYFFLRLSTSEAKLFAQNAVRAWIKLRSWACTCPSRIYSSAASTHDTGPWRASRQCRSAR
jgi:hypothetical protein